MAKLAPDIAVAYVPYTGNGRQKTEAVYDQLRRAILRDEIPAGVPISQVQLAQRLGVSQTPLREALRLLQREGLIHAEPNRRVRVTGLSVADLDELYALRITMEAFAIRLSVPHLTAPDLERLDMLLAEMQTASEEEEYERFEVPHARFHQGLVAYAGERCTQMVAQLSDHAERYRRAYTTQAPRAWSKGIEEHRAILAACKAGDGAVAAERLARHYSSVVLGMLAMIAPEHDPVPVRAALRMVLHTSP